MGPLGRFEARGNSTLRECGFNLGLPRNHSIEVDCWTQFYRSRAIQGMGSRLRARQSGRVEFDTVLKYITMTIGRGLRTHGFSGSASQLNDIQRETAFTTAD